MLGGDRMEIHTRIIGVAIVAWIVATILTWPLALSFGDEVGYVGQTRAALEGGLRPATTDVAVLVQTERGNVPKYPPAFPLALAPWFHLWPPAVFAVSVLALLGMTMAAARLLRSFGHDPTWALLFLAHPTFVLLGRTAMADVPLAALTVVTWASMRRGRPAAMGGFTALLVLCKPTGILLGALLGLGELLRRRFSGQEGILGALRRLWPAMAGGAAGLAVVLLLNHASTGTLWYAYEDALGARQVWALSHWQRSGMLHLITLLTLPPGLLLGAYPLWKKREWGPLLVVGGYTGLMCSYFFVDTGASLLETWILSPRLILPAVALLLVGYAMGLDILTRKRPALLNARFALAIVAVGAAAAVGQSHNAWLTPMAEARHATESVAAARGAEVIGSWRTPKETLLTRLGLQSLDTRPPHGSAPLPDVILCSERYRSRRSPGVSSPCELEGYREARSLDGYVILERARKAP
jgi:hypothetical protein